MKHLITLLALLLISSGGSLAQSKVTASLVPGGDNGEIVAAIKLEVVDEKGKPIQEIIVPKSSAADPSGGTISVFQEKDGEDPKPIPLKRVVTPGGDDGIAPSINLFLAEEVEKDAAYRIEIQAVSGLPVFTFIENGLEKVIRDPLSLRTGMLDAEDEDFLKNSTPLKSSVELGGGEEGSLISLRIRYASEADQKHEFLRIFANLEADLTPSDDLEESLIYGRVLGEVNGLRQVPFPADGMITGSAFYGFSSKIESDQAFNNWDSSVGLTAWWFVQSGPIDSLGRLLRFNRKDLPVHPLALKIDGSYIIDSEREAEMKDPEDIRVSARLLWMNRLYSDASLPFLDPEFHINLLVDVGAAWEPDGDSFHPVSRVSLEFTPVEFKNEKMAFTLTYAKGEFAPTFVDDEAFLAGLKFRF